MNFIYVCTKRQTRFGKNIELGIEFITSQLPTAEQWVSNHTPGSIHTELYQVIVHSNRTNPYYQVSTVLYIFDSEEVGRDIWTIQQYTLDP